MRSKAAPPGSDALATRELAELDHGRDVSLVLAFLNTVDVEASTDVLEDPEQWAAWCAQRGLTEPASIQSATEVRDAMRASVTRDHGRAVPPAVSARWPLQVMMRDGVPILTSTDAVGAVLAAAVHLVATDHWDRLKICPAEDCLWAFYDRSRNRSRTWCSMSVCGNREKARSWRERHTS